MQITISRRVLADALSELTPLAAKKQFVAILSNVKCVVKGQRMRLQTSDSTMTMRKYVELVDADSDGDFMVDCVTINNFVGKVKDDTLILTLQDSTLAIKHSKGCAKIPALAADMFPEVNAEDKIAEFEVPSSVFGRLVNSAKNFVATDDFRPIMKNINVKIEDGIMTMSATDTHQLFTDKATINTGDISVEWNVEQYAIPAIVKACKNTDKMIVSITERNVQYRLAETTIFTQKSEGNYPNVARVIPQSHVIEVTCDKSEILDAVSRLMMFTEQSKIIKVSVSPLSLDLSVDNIETMCSVNDTVTCTSNGDLAFGVNSQIFMNCINCCESQDVIIELNDYSRPIMVKDKYNPDRVVICMPMTITHE